MSGRLELHYSPDIHHLTTSFLQDHPAFLNQNGTALFIVNDHTRVQQLRNQWQLKKSGDMAGRFPFITFSQFQQRCYEQLSISRKILTFLEKSLLIKQIIFEKQQHLHYFIFPDGNFPDDTIRKITHFFDTIRLQEAGDSVLLKEKHRLILSSSDKLHADLDLLFSEFSGLLDTDFMDEAALLKEIMNTAQPEFFKTYYPQLNTLVYEDVTHFKKVHIRYFEWLKKRGFSVYLLLPYGRNPEIYSHKASLFGRLKKIVNHMQLYPDANKTSRSLFQIGTGAISFDDRISISSGVNRLREVEETAAQLKKLVVERQFLCSRIGITSPQLDGYMPALETVFGRYGIPYRVEKRKKLIQARPVKTLETLLRAVRDGYPLQTLQQILQSPFFRYREKLIKGNLYKILSQMRVKSGRENIMEYLAKQKKLEEKSWSGDREEGAAGKFSDMEDLFRDFFRDVHFFQSSRTAEALYEKFLDLLRKNKISRNILSSAEEENIKWAEENLAAMSRLMEILYHWKENIRLCAFGYKFSPQDFYEIFMFLASTATFSGYQSFKAGVKIVPLDELMNYQFDAVFTLGMEDGIFPGRSDYSFAHPASLPSSLKLFVADDQLLREREKFLQLLYYPSQFMRFSYSRFHQDQPLLPSIFIRELQRISDKSLEAKESLHLYSPADLISHFTGKHRDGKVEWNSIPSSWKRFLAGSSIKQFNFKIDITRKREETLHLTPWDGLLTEDPLAASWLESRFVKARFSPTQLEVFAHCPQIYFFERILRIKPPEEPEEYLSPLEKGLLVHSVLYRLFHDNDAANRNMEKLLEIAATELEKMPVSKGLLWQLEKEFYLGNGVQKGLFRAFWEYEQEISPAFTTVPRHFELSFGNVLDNNTDVDAFSSESPFVYKHEGEEFLFRGKIDRVELNRDETLLIVDYKTGILPTLQDIWNGEHLQLPIYLKAIYHLLKKKYPQLTMGGGAFYALKKEKDIEKRVVFLDRNCSVGSVGLSGSAQFPNDKYSEDQQPVTIDRLLERSLRFATAYIRSIRSGNFPHTGEVGRCRRWDGKMCEYLPLCRVSWTKIRNRRNSAARAGESL